MLSSEYPILTRKKYFFLLLLFVETDAKSEYLTSEVKLQTNIHISHSCVLMQLLVLVPGFRLSLVQNPGDNDDSHIMSPGLSSQFLAPAPGQPGLL